MAITITRADVKRKAMVPASETAYDTSIDSLIAETQPAVEFSIVEAYLNDTSNAGLQAALKLGMLEIVSGELLQQLAREFGSTEQFSIGGVTVGEMKERGPTLVQQGTVRLAPYTKTAQPAVTESFIQSTTKDLVRLFTLEEVP